MSQRIPFPEPSVQPVFKRYGLVAALATLAGLLLIPAAPGLFHAGSEHNRHDNDSEVCRKFRIHSSGKCAAKHDSIRHEHILRSTIHPNGHPADHNSLSAHWTSVCHVLEVSWISLRRGIEGFCCR
jgi:hypothetical protein